MSVRVNLLPGDVAKRGQAARSRVLAALGGVVVLVLLAGIWWLQQQQIADREDQLASEQAANEALRAQITILQPFADLEQRRNDAAETVGLALGTEVSIAGILQDLSAAMPPDVEIQTMTLSVSELARAPSPGGTAPIYGQLSMTGRVSSLSPGIERLLIDVSRIAGFENPAVTSATTDEFGYTLFTMDVELGAEVLTGRYTISEVAG